MNTVDSDEVRSRQHPLEYEGEGEDDTSSMEPATKKRRIAIKNDFSSVYKAALNVALNAANTEEVELHNVNDGNVQLLTAIVDIDKASEMERQDLIAKISSLQTEIKILKENAPSMAAADDAQKKEQTKEKTEVEELKNNDQKHSKETGELEKACAEARANNANGSSLNDERVESNETVETNLDVAGSATKDSGGKVVTIDLPTVGSGAVQSGDRDSTTENASTKNEDDAAADPVQVAHVASNKNTPSVTAETVDIDVKEPVTGSAGIDLAQSIGSDMINKKGKGKHTPETITIDDDSESEPEPELVRLFIALCVRVSMACCAHAID
jgi:myosin heavy subunit